MLGWLRGKRGGDPALEAELALYRAERDAHLRDGRYLRARLDAGDLTPEAHALALHLGDPEAWRATGKEPPATPDLPALVRGLARFGPEAQALAREGLAGVLRHLSGGAAAPVDDLDALAARLDEHEERGWALHASVKALHEALVPRALALSREPIEALERRARETGSVDDATRALSMRVRAGDVTRDAVGHAARRGHAPALRLEPPGPDAAASPWLGTGREPAVGTSHVERLAACIDHTGGCEGALVAAALLRWLQRRSAPGLAPVVRELDRLASTWKPSQEGLDAARAALAATAGLTPAAAAAAQACLTVVERQLVPQARDADVRTPGVRSALRAAADATLHAAGELASIPDLLEAWRAAAIERLLRPGG